MHTEEIEGAAIDVIRPHTEGRARERERERGEKNPSRQVKMMTLPLVRQFRVCRSKSKQTNEGTNERSSKRSKGSHKWHLK